MERNQMKAMKWIEFDDGVKFNHLIGMGYSFRYFSLHPIITIYLRNEVKKKKLKQTEVKQ